MHRKLFLLLFYLVSVTLISQTIYPKREQRATWVSTVYNVDYPSSSSLTSAQQKTEFTNALNKFKQAGINVVYVQVRPSCDAFYSNPNEPWSQWLNGTQGLGPSPTYDPLAFYITEAHKRGMELHVWINPYRSVLNVTTSSIASSHVSVQHSSWNVLYNNGRVLNPGLQAVRNYVSNVIMYIVRKYDLDGVHFDDYFYPYPVSGQTFNDAAAFSAEPRGFTNIDNWRRDNVNIFVAMIHDSIKAVKKHVKFGISPFGIWKSGTPAGITGLSSYFDIYCDPINWLADKKVDYILPQLYWRLGGSQDFDALTNWWGTQAMLYDRHCYAGIATYRMGSSNGNWASTEILNQINTTRTYNNKVQGTSLFSSSQLINNTKGISDSLANNQNKYLCLLPTMPWLDSIKPNPPVNVTSILTPTSVNFNWQLPAMASDGDSVKYFVVYRFANATLVNLNNAKAIIGITTNDTTGFIDRTPLVAGNGAVYVITACDRLHNESNPIQINLCNSCDNVKPTTQIATLSNWQTKNFIANYTDADNSGGSGIDKNYYQASYFNGAEWRANGNRGFFNDDFTSTTINTEWISPTGTWAINTNALEQTDEALANTNMYASLMQTISGSYLYNFKATISGTGTNRRAGIYIACDNASLTQRGNSYLIWFKADQGTIEFYKSINNTIGSAPIYTVNCVINPNTTYDYKITYNNASGEIKVWLNDNFVTSWTDANNPITTGNAISFRSGNCKFRIDDVKVFRSRTNITTLLVGNANTNDLRNENSSPTIAAGKISSITKDNANNLSTIATKTINIDWTKPFIPSRIEDGSSVDIDTTGIRTQLSLNYTTAKDTNSGIANYYYAIGSGSGLNDVSPWAAIGINTITTKTGLNLVNNQKYYTMVKAINGAGIMGDSLVSDGVLYLDGYVGVKENILLNELSVYPNPVTHNATLSLVSNSATKATYHLIDALGKLIEQKQLVIVSGINTLQIQVAELNLAKGIYYIKLTINNDLITKKLIIE